MVSLRSLLVVALLVGASATSALAQSATDTDGDSLPDAWEILWGLNPNSSSAADGRVGDPDKDGVNNQQEYINDTHPRGFQSRFLAEGVSSSFFDTTLSFVNPAENLARLQVRFLLNDRTVVTKAIGLPGRSSLRLDTATIPELRDKEFSTVVDSDVVVVTERRLSWQALDGYGMHLEGGVAKAATSWYLAEGATHSGFQLFYLIANPNAQAANVAVRYLTPTGQPLTVNYSVPARSRYTIWVNQVPGLSSTDVSATFSAPSATPVVVERAMYLRSPGGVFNAGHDAAGITAPATTWHFAEGATGSYFDLFVLIANPASQTANLRATYSLSNGETYTRDYSVPANRRFNIWVDEERINGQRVLADAAVAVSLQSLNGVAVVAERAMWWPGPTAATWAETHDSAGSVSTSARWVLAEGDARTTPYAVDTYILVANRSAYSSLIRVTLLPDGGTPVERTFLALAHSRLNVAVNAEFPEVAGRTFGAIVESIGSQPAQLVVERSIYMNGPSGPWSAGGNAFAVPLPSLLKPTADIFVPMSAAPFTVPAASTVAGSGPVTYTVSTSVPNIVTASVNSSGVVSLVPLLGANGTVAVTVRASAAQYGVFTDTFLVYVGFVPAVTFDATVAGTHAFFPTVADFNGDGHLEFVGATNNGSGTMVPWSLASNGLSALQPLLADDRRRDSRAADFNGDGKLDLVFNLYTSVTDTAVRSMLFFGNGDGTFVESQAFRALDIRGYGETITVADFDNDGDNDLFIPHYTHNSASEHNYLLINDGTGRFTDIADTAGVAMRNWPGTAKVEGAHAFDFDQDGWIDLFVGSHFFFNNRNLTFSDRRQELGLPVRFDEGLKFLDWNNDGYFDLMSHDPWVGPSLYEYDGTRFTSRPVIESYGYLQAYGANVADLNNDGREDIVTAGGATRETRVLMNTGWGFVDSPPSLLSGLGNDALAFADIDKDGRLDLVKRDYLTTWFRNRSDIGSNSSFTVEVVGSAGQQNQHGRVLKIRPVNHPQVVMSRTVDGGSGFLSQGQYPVLVGTPYAEPHEVTVYFDNGPITFIVHPGERKRVARGGAITNLP